MRDGDAAGEEARLRRHLGQGTATSVVVANMIGTGIFTTTGLMLARLESGWLVMACWLAGGLVAMCGALSYAELAVMMPRAGGEYVYLRDIYGPLAGFLTGWISFFVGFSAPIAATGVAVSAYLSAAGILPGSRLAGDSTAILIVFGLTALHAAGLRAGAIGQNVLTVLKLVLLGGLVAAGFAIGQGSWRFFEGTSEFWSAGEPGQIGIALLWVMFAYSGWNASTYIGGEVRRPEHTLPRSLLFGTAAVTMIYLAINLLLFFAAPAAELRGVVAVGDVAARRLFGPGSAAGFSILIALALLSSLSAYVMIGPRVYYAMARDGLFFRFAARVHPRSGIPTASILLQGSCAAVLVLFGSFDQLLTYIGFALGLFPWMAVLGIFILRRRDPGRDRPYRVWGYPIVPLVYLVAGAGILIVAFLNRPGPSLLALLTVAVGIPVYRMAARRGLIQPHS
jgi:APA family basic amino acid/polyamine antiporter